jgi:hypothetical protein
MGDEVGELTLEIFDGGDYCDVSFDLFSDDDENKKDRKQKSDIRKSISKSITPEKPKGLTSGSGWRTSGCYRLESTTGVRNSSTIIRT